MGCEREETRFEDREIGEFFAFEVDGGEEVALDFGRMEDRSATSSDLRQREAVSGH